ncbi:MAG: AAA family ATPase [Gammaproteobacteria bacterium]|nr:AAA family ATPase [Gammaproteobacteria bacterium]MDH3431083.1 AAA family ATPase [Gammaproteobacteria bacterium]
MNIGAFREFEVSTDQLRKTCDLQAGGFRTSAEFPAETGRLGQRRAIDAIRFGIQIRDDGHNVFVLGPAGSNRHGLAEELAKERAASESPPGDWCYVNNFADPERPQHLHFPPGRGRKFRKDLLDLIGDLRVAIPAAFESDDYRAQLKAVEEKTQKEVEAHAKSLEDRARAENIAVLQTPTGYVLAPIRDGKVIDEKEFAKRPVEERKETQESIERLSEELQSHIEQIPKLQKRHRERVKALNREFTEHAVGVSLSDLMEKYLELPAVVAYLEDVRSDIIENADSFQAQERPSLPFLHRDASQAFSQYEVNLIVSHDEDAAAPVIFEPNPHYTNIIGKIEHRAEMGALFTDFRMIRPGALLAANGGYLILDMHRVLTRPFVWEALKQALFAKQVRIESPGEAYGFVGTTSLQPEPVPLDIKVILVGERWLYHLLAIYDSEFNDLFKVAADLDDDLERTSDNVEAFASLIASRIRDKGLLPFSLDAMQKIVEQRARRADDSERLSMHMGSLEDLLTQADFWARQHDAQTVDANDVTRAIDEMARRLGRMRTRIIDAIRRDTLLIDTDGACTGQVNGLSVTDLGEFRFGHPVRITATTRIGSGRVVDIEREVELGGPIHSKGVMILAAALSSRYAREVPLSLHANIVFEQSYGGVEGDSASVAELCALLSSLADVPIRQNLAITGSTDQLGRIQVIGGVNEKIEGFFDLCKERGLDGNHGVIIPRDNVKHLMLREDVVAAVEREQFNIFAVKRVDEALTLLTGVEAGQRDDAGEFPEDSVNARVEKQLIRYAGLRKTFAEGSKGDEKK